MLAEYFGDRTLLLPDMAFCIPEVDLQKYTLEETKTKLTIERKDCESLSGRVKSNEEGYVSDWPTFEHSFHRTTFLNKVLKESQMRTFRIYQNIVISFGIIILYIILPKQYSRRGFVSFLLIGKLKPHDSTAASFPFYWARK